MQILKRLFFAQTIFINLKKLCSSKIYLKPDDTFDLQNSLDSEFSPIENNFIVVLGNDNLQPADQSTKISKERAFKGFKLAEIDKTEENDASNLDIQHIGSLDLDSEEINTSDLDTAEIDSSDLEIGDLNLNNVQLDILRKRWSSSCDKKASKTCISACKNAYKIVCSSYRCRRRMKRDFKRECKMNCKSKFVGPGSSKETDVDYY
nr:uncharacterized protein LOC117993981 [Maniola hyperantus]